MILIGFSVLALDCGGAIMAFGMTDRACRDAARAAAQGSNPTEARQLANAIIGTYANSSGVLTSPRIESVTYTDFGGHPPDGSSPFVTVTTSASARVLAPLSFFGHDLLSSSFPMRKTYTFPIVKLDVDS
jgi:Flp pilus assembly protein TadG